MAAEVFTNSGSWTWPEGVTDCTVELIGGGGSGGHAGLNPACTAGGRAGSYARKSITKGAESTLTITVGAGGIGTGGDVNGSASTVVQGGSTVASAAGGAGVAANGTTGATGIIGSNTGDVTYLGGAGGNPNGTTTSGAGGGAAGPSGAGAAPVGQAAGVHGGGNFLDGTHYCGNGGAGVAVRTNGNPGANYGGGGAGGNTNQQTDKYGGDGAPGVVVVTWTAPTISKDYSDACGLSLGEVASVIAIIGTSLTLSVGFTESASKLGFETLQTLGGSASSYSDEAASPGTTYTYRVVAVNADGETASNQEEVTTTADSTPKTASDSVGVAVGESTALAITDNKTASDTVAVAAAEGTPTLEGASSRTDSLGLAAVESASIYGETSASDNVNVSVADNVQPPDGGYSGFDTLGVSLGESVNVLVRLSRSDSLGLSLTESATPTLDFAFTDAATLELGQTAGTATPPAFTDKTGSDTLGVSFTEAASLLQWETIDDTLGGSAAAFSDTTVSPSTTYQYRVVGVNASGEAVSNTVQATTPASDLILFSRSDTLGVSLGEAKTLDGFTGRSDSLDVAAAASVNSLVSTSSVTDTVALTAADTRSIYGTANRSDTVALAAVEGASDLQQSGGDPASLTLQLVDGTAVRASRVITPTASLAEYRFDLTAGEIASITSSDLRLRLVANNGQILVSNASVEFSTTAPTPPTPKANDDTLSLSLGEQAQVAQLGAPGFRGLFAPWTGGGAYGLTPTGFQSLFALWAGGGSASPPYEYKSATDTVSVTAVEGTPDAAATLSRTDAVGLTVSETSGIFRSIQSSDTLSVAAGESVVLPIVSTLSRTDSLTVLLTGPVGIFSTSSQADTLAIATPDARVIFAQSSRSDTVAVATGESALKEDFAPVDKNASDSLNLAVDESAAVVIGGGDAAPVAFVWVRTRPPRNWRRDSKGW